MFPPGEGEYKPSTATNLFPSADEAANAQIYTLGTLFDIQVAPALVETQVDWPAIANNLFPSAEEAMESQAPVLDAL